MNASPIFILGMERSGTTLLMRMLNTVDGVRIYGESGGVAHLIAKAHRALVHDLAKDYQANLTDAQAEKILGDPAVWQAHTGAFQTKRISALTRSYVEALGNPFGYDRRWGFKEVRITDPDTAEMLVELYPNCRIIHTVRDPEDLILELRRLDWLTTIEEKMMWWVWKARSFQKTAKEMPANCYLLKYEDIARNIGTVFNWLGLPYTEKQQEVLRLDVGRPTVEVGLTEDERRTIRRLAFEVPLYPNEFDATYSKGGWDGHGSGLGSTPEYCAKYVAFLHDFLVNRGVRSVVDAGCGDWQHLSSIPWKNLKIAYTGVDISSVVIDSNRERYPEVNFIMADAAEDPLPDADLLIIKDVVHHVSPRKIQSLIERASRYLLVLWIGDIGEKYFHGVWPHAELMHYFDDAVPVFRFENPEGYPYPPKVALLKRNL